LIHASFRINRSEIDIARSSIVYVCSADLFDRTITPREIMNKQELIEAAAAASCNSKAAVADTIKALSNAAMCRPPELAWIQAAARHVCRPANVSAQGKKVGVEGGKSQVT
jgi:hypothetical protein